MESSQFDIGTTSIKLVRVGNVLQILFSSPLGTEYLHKGWQKGINGPRGDWGRVALEKLTKRKEAELRLIAVLTFDATIAAEAKLAKLPRRVERSSA